MTWLTWWVKKETKVYRTYARIHKIPWYTDHEQDGRNWRVLLHVDDGEELGEVAAPRPDEHHAGVREDGAVDGAEGGAGHEQRDDPRHHPEHPVTIRLQHGTIPLSHFIVSYNIQGGS